MPTAKWNGQVLAQSEATIRLEGNHYFPPDSVRWEFFERSDSHTRCPWKGIASYYDIVANGKRNRDAAWTYPEPSEAAAAIKDHVGFWHGVEVVD